MNRGKPETGKQKERAAVRRLLMYWGNAERTRAEKEQLLVSLDEEMDALYDLRPQQLTGMPRAGVSDSTPAAAQRASREARRLERKKQRIEDELQRLNYWAGMIEFEVMCLPPLECEVIRLRYVKYGTAKRGYWERIARQLHLSTDWAKTLERQGVDRLIGRISA